MIKERIEKLKARLNVSEAILIFSSENRLYFSGFKSSAGAILITKASETLFVDFRYFEKAKQTVSSLSVIQSEKLYYQIGEILSAQKIKTVFLETNYVNLEQFSVITSSLPDFEISKSDKISKEINLLRSVKSEKEISLIKSAQTLTDETFSHILNFIKEGKTEKEIALEMEFFMRKKGSEEVAFDFIVVSGKNSSLPHGVPTDKAVKKGDFITMDFGAVVGGYRSDMTRTVAIGGISEEQQKVYNTVLTAQNLALEKIAPFKKCCEIDKIARDYIYSCGYEGCFGHGLGHSVGLLIHENPSFNTRDTTPLEKGMVLTVEPGIYLENKFGVRIEDMVAITDTDYVNLTKSPKNLIIL